nr:unnamed protein product [Haemonchus contortus]
MVAEAMLEGSEAKKILARILAKLTAQNELLLVADVFEFYDQHNRAEEVKLEKTEYFESDSGSFLKGEKE